MEVLAAPLEQSEIDELVPQLLEGLDGIMRRQCDKETLSTSYRRDSFTLAVLNMFGRKLVSPKNSSGPLGRFRCSSVCAKSCMLQNLVL